MVFLAQEQEQDAFFETAFDGEWTGYVRMNTAQGKWDFPMVLNLNIHGDTGIGFAFLSDDLQTAPTGFKLYELQNIQIRGKKITVQIDSALPLLTNKVEDAFIHIIKLSYKNATDTLKGSFTSSDPDLGRGSVLLYHQDSSKEIQPVFNQNCALSGCHTGASPSQGLNLSSGQAYSNIVNVPSSQMSLLNRITPFKPADSYLIRKIKGQGITGSRMPLNRQPLSSETITKFETWVNEGAKNN